MYKEYYKFNSKPFKLTPDPQFFYASRTHKRALSYLRYGIEQGEGLIIITGDVGTGKTTLAARLTRMIDKNLTVSKLVNSQLRPEELLKLASAELGLKYENESKAVLLKNLENYCINCMEEGKRVLLIVDEAQNLKGDSLEELRMLSNLQWNGRQLIQCFLLAQNEFRSMIKAAGFEQLRQRIIAAYHLNALDEEETKNYILHRLNLAGWNGDPVIHPDIFPLIYKFTTGIPRKINLLLDRILLFGCLEELHELGRKEYQEVLLDIKDEYWSNSEEINTNEVLTNKNHSKKAKKKKENKIDDLQDRIKILEQSLQNIGGTVSNEIKGIKELLVSEKEDNK